MGVQLADFTEKLGGVFLTGIFDSDFHGGELRLNLTERLAELGGGEEAFFKPCDKRWMVAVLNFSIRNFSHFLERLAFLQALGEGLFHGAKHKGIGGR